MEDLEGSYKMIEQVVIVIKQGNFMNQLFMQQYSQ